MIKEVEKRVAMFSIKTGTAAASCRPDPIREKGVLKSPQAFQNPKISNIFSSEAAQSNAEGILNRPSHAISAQGTSLRRHIILRHGANIIASAHHCRAATLPSASTAAAMAGAAAEAAAAERTAPKGAASAGATEGPAAKAAARRRPAACSLNRLMRRLRRCIKRA